MSRYTAAAILTEPQTTVTAFQVPGTTGLGVIDGTTLSFRHQGLTLNNGVAVSIGFDGLEDKTTTVFYEPLTASNSVATTATPPVSEEPHSAHNSPTTASASSTGSGSNSSGTAPKSIGAGKAVALVFALAGLVACGL